MCFPCSNYGTRSPSPLALPVCLPARYNASWESTLKCVRSRCSGHSQTLTHTRTRTRTHAYTHAHTRTHTHLNTYKLNTNTPKCTANKHTLSQRVGLPGLHPIIINQPSVSNPNPNPYTSSVSTCLIEAERHTLHVSTVSDRAN